MSIVHSPLDIIDPMLEKTGDSFAALRDTSLSPAQFVALKKESIEVIRQRSIALAVDCLSSQQSESDVACPKKPGDRHCVSLSGRSSTSLPGVSEPIQALPNLMIPWLWISCRFMNSRFMAKAYGLTNPLIAEGHCLPDCSRDNMRNHGEV